MVTRVWLLGGTGKVGSDVAALLDLPGYKIITVSRRAAKAGQPGHHVQADLKNPATHLDFETGDRVINLSEATGTPIIKSALKAGAIFIETSATPDYVLGNRKAVQGFGGPGVLLDCVGVAPGLTNLMAHAFMHAHPTTDTLNISVELGMGEHAGPAATKWFFESLGSRFPARINGRAQQARTADFVQKVPFSEDRPARMALNFPFVEQSILAADFKENTRTVLSFLALSPAWLTRGLSIALRLHLGGFLSRRAAVLSKLLLAGPPIGETTTRIVVSGLDRHAKPTGMLRLETGAQSRATAVIVAAAAQAKQPRTAGPVTSIADWITLDAAVDALRRALPQTRISGPKISTRGATPGTIPPTVRIAE